MGERKDGPFERASGIGRRVPIHARPGIALLFCLSAAGCLGVGRTADGHHQPLVLTPCHVDRLAEEVLCGSHEVFEDRHARAGRRLSIQVTVLPARRRAAEPDPLLIFAGGPGQGARGYAAVVDRFFSGVRRTRDLVLVDLRGTGDSGRLSCPSPADEVDQIESMLDADGLVTRCLAALDADPRHYTHAAALSDVDEVRQRLGYATVNLWGGSWGTRTALLYALDRPEAVRSVVLDGAVPLDMGFPRSAAADAEQAFARLADACRAEARCASRFGDVRARLGRLLERLGRSPEMFEVDHPRTGRPARLRLTRDVVAEIVRVSLYTPSDAVRLFEVVSHFERGDAGPLLAQALRLASISTDDMALGATLSVLCSEDVPSTAHVDFGPESASTFVRAAYADTWRARCRHWPRGPALAVSPDAVSPAPVLILSGEHDPVTPPRWGERMRAHFPASLHVVVPGAAHNASFTGCVPELIVRFLDAGPDGIGGTTCVERVPWPPIVVSETERVP